MSFESVIILVLFGIIVALLFYIATHRYSLSRRNGFTRDLPHDLTDDDPYADPARGPVGAVPARGEGANIHDLARRVNDLQHTMTEVISAQAQEQSERIRKLEGKLSHLKGQITRVRNEVKRQQTHGKEIASDITASEAGLEGKAAGAG